MTVTVTLKDAAAYIMKLPRLQQSREWRATSEAVIMAADTTPLMRAHFG